MKKEFSIFERPEKLAGYKTDEYLKASGNMSWYDFVTAMPLLAFVVTGYKSNGKQNACLHAWASFSGSGADNYICILSKADKGGHMYQSLKETKCCVLNFPSGSIIGRCFKTTENNQFETDEITASGLTAEKSSKVNAPRIKESFLNIECEYLWEHDLFEGSREAAVALRAVNICMDSTHYDQNKLGRYGGSGYLFFIDQPVNPDTGEIAPVMTGTVEPSPFKG